MGSIPLPDAARYPTQSELVALLEESAWRLRSALPAQPLPDPSLREILPTLGHALLQVVAAHSAFHAGQLALWRGAIGKAPVLGFQ